MAERQHGLVTRSQLVGAGLSETSIDRRMANGSLVAIFPSVYRVPGAPVTRHQQLMAAALWATPHGLISHASAGTLLHLDGVVAPPLIDLLVPRRYAPRASGVAVHRTMRLPRIDRVVVDGIPCTSATRTLIDLAPLVDEELLETAFHCARRYSITSPAHLARRFEALGGKGRPGSTAIRRLLEAESGADRALESRLEVKAARLLRRSGLPRPNRQQPVASFRLDFAWPDSMVAVECDGFAWHGNRLQWKRDRRRVAAIEALGWRVLFVTWDDVTERPDQTLHRIELALSRVAA